MAEGGDTLISYCGYNCHLCAARSEDIAVRQKLVDAWCKYLGHEKYTAENVYCVGCKNEGPHPEWLRERNGQRQMNIQGLSYKPLYP